MELREGQVIANHALVRKLGGGAFGEVWLVRHVELGAQRAMKIPTDAQYVKHLRQEGQIQFSLTHANVVRTLDLNTAHTPPYFLMEYIEGMSLRHHLRARGKLPLGEVLRVIGQVLQALAAAHAQNVIHRDIKPENVLVTASGQVKVADFGLGHIQAAVERSLLFSGSMMTRELKNSSGTIEYMSPEARAGGSADARDDVYAVGVLACELVTGLRPSGLGIAKLFQRAGVDRRATALFEKALEDVNYRYQSAGEMGAAVKNLAQALDDEARQPAQALSVPLEAAGPGEEFRRQVAQEGQRRSSPAGGRARRSALLPVAMVVLVLAVAAGVVVLALRRGDAPVVTMVGQGPATSAPASKPTGGGPLPAADPSISGTSRPASNPSVADGLRPATMPQIADGVLPPIGPESMDPLRPTTNRQVTATPDPVTDVGQPATRVVALAPPSATNPSVADPPRPATYPQVADIPPPAIEIRLPDPLPPATRQFALAPPPATKPVMPDTPRIDDTKQLVRPIALAGGRKGLSIDLGESVSMELAEIPAGSFKMGSPEGEDGRQGDETQHVVKLSRPFFMGLTLVTQAQWKALMGRNPANFRGDALPVEQVSWNDAVDFCGKLSQKIGRPARLPTEAQWEYACRAGTTTPYWTGAALGTDEANYKGDEHTDAMGLFRKRTTSVDSFAANAWGLRDMHGNVWQWCADWYEPNVTDDAATDPTGPRTGKARVIRGGSWNELPKACRSAFRGRDLPVTKRSDGGFRVVVDAQ